MDSPLDWIAAILTIVAAGMVAANIGRVVTGWAFILYTGAAISWIIAALSSDKMALAIQNGVLLIVNLFGIYQYLLNPHKKKVIDRVEQVAERIERQVEAEENAAAA
jgi:Mg2+/Co2+ transporter CorB